MADRSNLARAVVPARDPRAPALPSRKPPHRSLGANKRAEPRVGGGPILAVILGVLAAVNIAGWPYYSLPISERVRSPLHIWLKPSGYVGQSAGILALAIFVFLWLYPLRKKFKRLAWTGSVAKWLDVHILAALGLPLLLAIHAAWRFEGLIGLGFLSMMIVVASGIVGRYLYVRIPRSKTGVELTREEVAARREALVEEIADALGLDVPAVENTLAIGVAVPGNTSAARALGQLLTNDIARWRMKRELRRRWKTMLHQGSFAFRVDRQRNRVSERQALDQVVQLASREMSLAQQARMLDATRKVFGFWHVAHRPFALTALVAVVIHVAVVIALGATWFR
jgi:hypothetical protein